MHSVNFDMEATTAIAIAPAAARTASVNGTAVDTARTAVNSQRVKSITFVVNVGAVTDGTFTLSIEESDASGSGYAAMDANRVSIPTTTFTSATPNVVRLAHCQPTKRYVRLVCTASGSPGTGAVYGAGALLLAD